MGLLSTAVSVIKGLSGLSVRAKVEIVMGVFISASVLVLWLWVRGIQETNNKQAKDITTLTGEKTVLATEKRQLQVDVKAARATSDYNATRTEILNQENKKNDELRRKYQKEGKELQKKLAKALENNSCAHSDVPADVIRMQQQSISEHNAKYSG